MSQPCRPHEIDGPDDPDSYCINCGRSSEDIETIYVAQEIISSMMADSAADMANVDWGKVNDWLVANPGRDGTS